MRRRAPAPVLAAFLVAAVLAGGGTVMADDGTGDGTDGPGEVKSLPALDALWDFGDPAATEARFLEILPAAREAGDPGYLAELLSQIARTRGLQRDFDGAHALLDEAEAACPAGPTRARVRILLERGRAFNSAGEKEAAAPRFLEAFVTAHRAGGMDGLLVDAVHMLGIVAEGESSVQWNVLAIDLAEKSDDPKAKRWLGSLYNNIGWSFHDQGDYETALDYWRRAEAWHAERDTGQGHRIARWMVARGLRSLGRYEEALERQRALLAAYEEAGVEEAGYGAEEIAENLLALGREDEARSWFAAAHAKLSKDPWLVENEPERLARLRELAGTDAGDDG